MTQNNNESDYDFKWECGCCDFELEVKKDVNGKCDNCGSEYKWDFDCDYEGAVYSPIFKCKE